MECHARSESAGGIGVIVSLQSLLDVCDVYMHKYDCVHTWFTVSGSNTFKKHTDM